LVFHHGGGIEHVGEWLDIGKSDWLVMAFCCLKSQKHRSAFGVRETRNGKTALEA
jgi:hypothetical protein